MERFELLMIGQIGSIPLLLTFAVIDTREIKSGGSYDRINRTIYDEFGNMSIQIHSGHHALPGSHKYGINGEHHHYYR